MTIKDTITFLKDSLKIYYNANEINSFIKIIFEDIFNIPYITVISEPNKQLHTKHVKELNNIIIRLKKNKPIQYIVGFTYFYDLKFFVNKNVLIPRPETEELVNLIISLFKEKKQKLNILDIGTGSGCIAVSLAKNIENSTVTAADIDENALIIAKKNAKVNSTYIKTLKMDILSEYNNTLTEKFDIIVSNPPYVRLSEKKLMQKNVLNYEPEKALFVSDNNPLIFYDRIAEFSLKNLKSGGALFFEINENLGNETVNILKEKGFQNITIFKDINKKNRIISSNI